MAAEPRSGDDFARLLMEKAAGDEKILLRLIDDDDIPDDGLGFHALCGYPHKACYADLCVMPT